MSAFYVAHIASRFGRRLRSCKLARIDWKKKRRMREDWYTRNFTRLDSFQENHQHMLQEELGAYMMYIHLRGAPRRRDEDYLQHLMRKMDNDYVAYIPEWR
ncbi:MAG TPA: hypothetical protein VHD69_01330 [Candidatus Paceibacterota bacterium]|nr:hypothetical protein [Candidatus Paceibacterota bacterium]